MDYSQKKAITLNNSKELKLSTFLIALLSAALIFLPYIIMGNGYFLFYGDFNAQQIPFYQMCHKMIKEGNVFWNWHTDLGVNFIGSYTFYLLGSPFFWLTIPFPNSFVPYLMGPLLILKFACASFTAYLYIRRFTRTPEAARLGGLLYAFCGFSVYNIFFNHFHESIICFPLLLLALEMLITENKRGVFALAVALCAVVNYFFFYGMVVFAVIYFFVRLFSGAVKPKFSRFAVVIFEAVIGFLLAGVFILPSIMAILDNNRITSVLLGWDAITYDREQIYLNIIECFFFPPDIPARPVFFPEAKVEWASLGGWLPIFGMCGIFTLFSEKKGSWLKRIIAVCIFMAFIPILNCAFYAFNVQYYARWFYMPILMMCLATVNLLEDKTVNFRCGYKWSAFVTVAFALVIGFFPQKDEKGKIIFGLYTREEGYAYTLKYWVAVLIAVLSLVILLFLLKMRKKDLKNFFKYSAVCVSIMAIIYGNVFIISGRALSVGSNRLLRDDIINNGVYLEDNDNFRIDVYDGLENDGMYLGLPSINSFHSVVPASVTEFYTYIDVERSVASRPKTDVPAIRSLLSVKYLLNPIQADAFVDEEGNMKMPDYKFLKSSGAYNVYENENYVPFGFSYNYYMTEDDLKGFDGNQKSRMMLKAVLLNDEQIKKYRDCLKNISELPNDEESKISLYLTDNDMKADAENLRKTSATFFKKDNNGFTAKVKRDNRSLVFFSVPYDEGFKATVNGQPVEIEKVNVGFMAVAVPSGESTIRFEYKTPGLAVGSYITIGALAVFLIYYLAASVYIRNHPSNTHYPEGDKLIAKWQKDDIADMEFVFDEISSFEESSILDKEKIEQARFDFEADDKLSNDGFTVKTEIFDE
ncbi:MAG: YfhO family protein [Clostridia bacterium]|nr:YfhO family protein [Clostridia bacterium]